jgi:DNA-binding NtrC family response regulator
VFTTNRSDAGCVILVEQEASQRALITSLLQTLGHEVVVRDSTESAIAAAVDHQPVAVLIGKLCATARREDVAAKLRSCCPSTTVSFVQLQEAAPSPAAAEAQTAKCLVGLGSAARQLQHLIDQVAACDTSVLITGETGTGKELVAELIHLKSARRNGPLVALNCSAFPEALFESELFGHEKGAFTGAACARIGKLAAASGGTLFLDEIGEMSPATQAKLLRVIENRTFYPLGAARPQALNVRIVAATNQDVERAVEMRRFRRDLFYRLNVIRIDVPPLRERREDVPSLCRHFLGEFNRQFGMRFESLAAETVELLAGHDWPGNVRELRNTIEAAFALCEERRATQLPLPMQIAQRLRDSCDRGERQRERARLVDALQRANWNKRRAAIDLDMSRMTLYRKLRVFGIERDDAPARADDPETD